MLNLHLLIIKLWKKNSIFLYLMFVFSGIYFIVSKLKEKFTKGYVSKKFIICVGNVVVGGAGKTPIAKFIAERLIKKGYKVCVIESRDHIGGNCFTSNKNGINVHEYGPHIFHTSNEEVWKWINQFVTFNNFTLRPVANYKEEIYSLPFNM